MRLPAAALECAAQERWDNCMTRFEYKVIPAPGKGRKGPGIKGPEARFAHGLEAVMNEMGAEGWEYQRSDILPSEERQGLTSSHTVYRSVLVFRRACVEERPAEAETTTAAPPHAQAPAPAPEPARSDATTAETSPASPTEQHDGEPASSDDPTRPS